MLPFSVQQKNENCLHNGLLSFLIADSGQISDVIYQISSETCLYFKFNLLGRAEATFIPSQLDQAQVAIERYQQLQSQQRMHFDYSLHHMRKQQM